MEIEGLRGRVAAGMFREPWPSAEPTETFSTDDIGRRIWMGLRFYALPLHPDRARMLDIILKTKSSRPKVYSQPFQARNPKGTRCRISVCAPHWLPESCYRHQPLDSLRVPKPRVQIRSLNLRRRVSSYAIRKVVGRLHRDVNLKRIQVLTASLYKKKFANRQRSPRDRNPASGVARISRPALRNVELIALLCPGRGAPDTLDPQRLVGCNSEAPCVTWRGLPGQAGW
jgi:hypothetical protein